MTGGDDAALDAFKEEVDAHFRYNESPAFVHLLGASLQPPRLFLITEFMTGMALATIVYFACVLPPVLQLFPSPICSHRLLSCSSIIHFVFTCGWPCAGRLPGGTLDDRIHKSENPLTYIETLHIARQIAEGLDLLHPTYVHRDLKPANILLDDQGNAKITG